MLKVAGIEKHNCPALKVPRYLSQAIKAVAKLTSILGLKIGCVNAEADVFLGKGVLEICSKFTRDHPFRSAISMGYYKPCHHPPPPTTIHHHPPPTKINPPPTTNNQSKPTAIHRHPK